MMAATNLDASVGPFARRRKPIIDDAVTLEYVAVGAHGLTFLAEKYAGPAVADDGVVTKRVICVLMPDGYAGPLVAPDLIVLEQAVLDPPTDEKPVPAVVDRAVTANDRMLRAASWV